MGTPTEASEQLVLVKWLRRNKINFFHPPNGGKRVLSEARLLKSMGVSAGVPDIIIVDPVPGYVATALELKRVSGGTVSKHQKVWLKLLKDRGWASLVARGARDAIKQLKELGYGLS
tara:strand:+ start:446 stop:796 length:351 start_codon:yes stop_codon:yes gene_type:complete